MPTRIDLAKHQFKASFKDTLRIDALQTSRRRFGTPPHWLAPFGSWKIDHLMLRMKWRKQLAESISESDRLLRVRFLVTRAWERAEDRAARARKRREAVLVARRGYPRSSGLKPRDPISAFARTSKRFAKDLVSLKMLDRLAESLKVDNMPIQCAMKGFANFDDLAKVARKIRSVAARGRAGDQLDTGIRGFLEDLAFLWWQATEERPDKRSASDPLKGVKFPHFAEAALADVGAGVGHSRAVRGVLDHLERDRRAPWH